MKLTINALLVVAALLSLDVARAETAQLNLRSGQGELQNRYYPLGLPGYCPIKGPAGRTVGWFKCR